MTVYVGRTDTRVSRDDDGFRLQETWQALADDGEACDIGPIAVITHPDLPQRGETYDPDGCDTPGSYPDLVVSRVNVGSLRKADNASNGCYREITVEYRSLTYGLATNFPEASADPLTWSPHVEISPEITTEPAKELLFLGGYVYDATKDYVTPCVTPAPAEPTLEDVVNSACNRVKGSKSPIASTAGELFNPPPELEIHDELIRISIISEDYDPNNLYECYRGGAINDNALTLSIPARNFTRTCEKHTLRMGVITGRPGYTEWEDDNGNEFSRTYWITTFDLHHRKRRWYREYFNVGTKTTHQGNNANEDDGFGGEFHYNDDFPVKRSPIGAVMDGHNLPLTRPVYLNKAGNPIRERQNPYVLRYLDGWEKDFSVPGLGLPITP